MNRKHRIAVCPGSYDPVTNGHLDVITRAAALYDEIVVAVVNASVRKTQPLFDAEERIAFIEGATEHLGNVRAEPFDVLVVEFARQVGAIAIVKGLRAISDFEYELEMNQLNRLQQPDIESVYLMAISAVLFPELQRSRGARHLRREDRRPRPGGRCRRLQEELSR